MRHVKPFKDRASEWLAKLSDVNETLESWMKTQQMWMSLEPVFTGGDIAKQMPTEARLFGKTDKEWASRFMIKAKDIKNVVDVCTDEVS
jgi:dynein heavy chain